MTATTCPKCGWDISSTAKFCRHCRYDLQSRLAPTPTPAPRPRRQRSWVTIGIALVVIFTVFCILAVFSYRKALQSRVGVVSQNPTVESRLATVQPVVVEMVVPTAVSQGQPVITVPVLLLPPTSSSSSLPTGQYDIVVAGGGDHPKGEISYSSAQTCMGGCGSYKATIELRGIRIVDQGFTLDLQIRISENSGDPWLFEANLGGIALEINGQTFMPKASNFPTQVTSPGSMSGYLSFYESIPLSTDGQYKVTLRMPTRLSQPLEGWLTPHK